MVLKSMVVSHLVCILAPLQTDDETIEELNAEFFINFFGRKKGIK